MPVLPIPMISALILAFLLLRALVRRDVAPPLMVLIAVCAAQSAIIALVQHYGVSALRPVQAVTASLIPPLAWLAFVLTAQRSFEPRRDLAHAAVPLLFLLIILLVPQSLDIAIPALFAFYGAALLLRLGQGRDSLIKTRLDSGEVPLLLWRLIALSLLVSGAADILILIDQIAWSGRNTGMIIGVISSLSLLTLGVISLSRGLDQGSEEPPREPDHDPESRARDEDLVERLDALLSRERLYLDPDLTLGKLARRLTVPVKQLSSAINRVKGENVSRHINRFRIAHASVLLANGETITRVMLASGFNTKSNFNREFLRIKGMPPSQWQEQAA